MKLLNIKLTSILFCLVLSCDNSSNETATIVELNNSKKALISKIDSLGVLDHFNMWRPMSDPSFKNIFKVLFWYSISCV